MMTSFAEFTAVYVPLLEMGDAAHPYAYDLSKQGDDWHVHFQGRSGTQYRATLEQMPNDDKFRKLLADVVYIANKQANAETVELLKTLPASDYKFYDLSFNTARDEDRSANWETNKGEMLSIMATLFKAADEVFGKERAARLFCIGFAGFKNDRDFEHEQYGVMTSARTRIYRYYAKQVAPKELTLRPFGNETYLYRLQDEPATATLPAPRRNLFTKFKSWLDNR